MEAAERKNGVRKGVRRAGKGVALVVTALGIAHVVILTQTVLRRMTFPFDYDWLEGAQMLQGFRLAHGLPLYGPVDHGFMAAPYPPVHPALMAILGSIFGFEFWVGRLVSIASLAMIGVLFTKTMWRQVPKKPLRWAFMAVACASSAIAYPALLGHLDMARVDTLAFAFVVASGYLVTTDGIVRGSWRYRCGLAFILALSVYTKQNNVFFAVAALVALAFRNFREAVRMALLFGSLCVTALVGLEVATHGWFLKWMLVMRGHRLVADHLPTGMLDSWRASPWLPLVPVFAIVAALKRTLTTTTKVWLAMWGAAIPACALPILAEGGARNNLISVAVLGTFVALLPLADLLRERRHDWRDVVGGVAFAAVLAAYMPSHFGSPLIADSFVPSAHDRREVERLHEVIRGLPGNVIFPMFPFVAIHDGKTDFQFSLVAYFDATERGHVPGDMPNGLLESGAPWVVTYGGYDIEGWVPQWLGSDYVLDREMPTGYRACCLWYPDTVRVYRRR